MRIFVISPVRNLNDESKNQLDKAIERLESQGHDVHLPYRDTNQAGTSMQICRENSHAMDDADIVAIWYDPDSHGSLFDLGMAFAMSKDIIILNSIDETPKKSFANLILEWEDRKKRP